MATKKKATTGEKKAPKAKAGKTKGAKASAAKAAKPSKASASDDSSAADDDTSFEDALDDTESDTEAAADGEGEAPSGGRRVSKASSLLVVESPAKAKTIQKYLGKDYIVLASKGHVKDLPKKDGVDTEHDFEETYEVIQEKGKEEVLKVIKQAARRTKRVLLATDPDREGEAIAWHLQEEILQTYPDKEIHRVLFNEITKKGVAEGIAHPRALDTHLYEAQRTRRVLDRIGGYPLSSLLWRKLAFGLSAGRVQTPALRIIVDRQQEIDSFIPVPYWLIEAQLLGNNRPAFTALLDSVNGEKLEKVSSRPAATSELDARRFSEDLARAEFSVGKINKRERKAKAPAPYTTSKLQQDASTRLGMQPKRTMRIAQGLYEGVQLGEETVGLITYMRTDSVRLSADAVTECREFIEKKYGKAALPDEPTIFKSKKANVQDAHEAVRPTRMDLPPDSIREFLTDERYRLYKLIWDRFVACQMMPAVYDQTGVEIEAKAGNHKYGLRVAGSVLRVAGWKAVYGAGDVALATDEEAGDDDEEKSLPVLTEGERLKLEGTGVQTHAKQTEPPPYFNEASLVKKLEEEGIGRPSTYAEIISKVQARDYVVKVGNKLMASPLGRLVIEHLVADQFDLADLGFTRKLEEDLDSIAEARGNRLDVLRPFHLRLQAKIAASLEDKGKWWPEPELLGEKCPDCGRDLFKRWGRNGVFVGCAGYDDKKNQCKFTRNLTADGLIDEEKQPVLTDYKCDICGNAMMRRWGRNGFFLGCSTFPKCKGTRNLPLGVDCPKCGGEIIEIRARKGARPFYGCSNYRSDLKCDFRIWQKPVNEACPQCNAKFLVRAGGANNPVLKCVAEGCGYQRADEEPTLEDGESPLPATGTEGEN